MFKYWHGSPPLIKAVSIYWAAYGIYAMGYAIYIFIMARFVSYDTNARELIVRDVIPLILLGYSLSAIFMSRKLIRQSNWARIGLGLLGIINTAWYAGSYSLYVRYLIADIDYIKFGDHREYLPQYPFFSFAQTTRPDLYNNVAYLILVATAIMVLLALNSKQAKAYSKAL